MANDDDEAADRFARLPAIAAVILGFFLSASMYSAMVQRRQDQPASLGMNKCPETWRDLVGDGVVPRARPFDLKTAGEVGDASFRASQRIDYYLCMATTALIDDPDLCGVTGTEFGLHSRIVTTRTRTYINAALDICQDDQSRSVVKNYTSSMCAIVDRAPVVVKTPNCIDVLYAPLDNLSARKKERLTGMDASCLFLLLELSNGDLAGCQTPGRIRCTRECSLFGNAVPTDLGMRKLLALAAAHRFEL